MLPGAIDAHDSAPQTATVPGDLQYRAGAPAKLEVLKGALQTKNYIFIKLPLAANNTSNIPGEKELLFAEDGVHSAAEGAAAGFLGCAY